MVLPVLAFCAGAASLQLLPALPPVGALTLWVAAGLAIRQRLPSLAAACCGFVWACVLLSVQLASDWPCSRDREDLDLTGRILTPAILRDGRVDFEFEAEYPRRLKLLLTWYDAPAVPEPGETWTLQARLRCRTGLANPGAPARELALLRQGVSATGYVRAQPAPRRLSGAGAERRVERLRQRVASGIAGAVADGPSEAVLQGLTVGIRATIADALWDAFAATGVAHLMAISGLHVTGCALAALVLLRGLRRLPGLRVLPRWREFQAAIVVAITAGYAWLSGASVPALRTLAMVGIAAGLSLARRHWPPGPVLVLAAFCLIVAHPLAVTSAGFWLSFAATATLFAVVQGGAGLAVQLAAFARAQVAILATLAPVLTMAFGRVSLVAPLANALAIPFFTFLLLPPLLVGTLLELAAEGGAAPVWRGLAALLDPVWPLLLAAAQWPFADWAPARPHGLLAAAAGVATMTALWLPSPGMRAAAAALLLAMVAGSPSRPATGSWTLTVLDVGQGLSAVVETGRHVLVFDAGPRWRGGGTAAEISLLPYLRARGIRRIDRLVVSHADQDHAGGAAVLADAIPVSAAPACFRGERWRWDGVDFEVLHPPPGMHGSDNDLSCALRVASAGSAALLLADPEARAESMLTSGPVAADVVLIPHHGSRSSSSPALVEAVRAQLAIASAGYGNRWGMPQEEVVARWRAAGTTVLTTAGAGAVTVRFDAGGRPVTAVHRPARWWRPDRAH